MRRLCSTPSSARVSSPTSWPPPGPTIIPTSPAARRAAARWCRTSTTAASWAPWFDKLRPALTTMMPLGGMMVGRNDLPHVFKMTQSARSALHVGRMVARHARDRLRYSRGTRLVNGNALIARLAVNAFARGIPLWLSSPIVELRPRTAASSARSSSGKAGACQSQHGAAWCWPAAVFRPTRTLKRADLRPSRRRQEPHAAAAAGNAGDGLRLAQTAGGRFHDEVHQPAAWTPVSLVPQARRLDRARSRISSIAASPATSASTGAAGASSTRPSPTTCSCRP